MATFLHLTDLHLSSDGREDAVGDYTKSAVVEDVARQSRTGIIRHTLSRIGEHLRVSRTTLDAVMISGDITYKNDDDGFALLPEILDCLGDSLPGPDRILISPGNHDVAWATEPGSAERYQKLVELRNATGYRTALLDGVDIDQNGRANHDAGAPYVVATDGSFILLALNSSNRSGTLSAASPEIRPAIDRLRSNPGSKDVELLIRELDARSLFDVARVDEPQLIAAAVALQHAIETVPGRAPMTFVSLHHPIGSVTAVEEVKPFETLTNLGQVRDWIASNQLDAVLHGHKHVASVAEDSHVPSDRTSRHRFAVFGGGAVGLGAPNDGECVQLITVDADAPRHHPVKYQQFHAIQPGQKLRESDLVEHELHIGRQEAHALGVVRGATVDDVFDVLLGWRASLDAVGKPLVCRVEDGSTALHLPARYPDLPNDVQDRQRWADDLIDWWQDPIRGAGAEFNHGERLKRFEGTQLNQLNEAARTLKERPESSRAVAVLLQPRTDFASDRHEFPSFALLHAFITDQRLHVVAYFRKQEIPHWWPINMGELAHVQKHLVGEVQDRHPEVTAGAITTVTALPVGGAAIPSVSIPWIDLHADQAPKLLQLIEPLITRDIAAAESAWRLVFAGWAEGESVARDNEPVPVEGIRRAVGLMKSLGTAIGKAPSVEKLIDLLEEIADVNQAYRNETTDTDRLSRRKAWVRRIAPKQVAVMNTVAEIASKA